MAVYVKYWKTRNKAQNTYTEKKFNITNLGHDWDAMTDDEQDALVATLPKIKMDWGYSIVRD